MARTPSNPVFRALADPTRREILTMLRGGTRTSGEIASRFESSWPTISRHLSVLANADLVGTTRKGAEVYYELNTSVFQDLVQYLLEWVTPRNPRGRMKRRATRPQET
jgi:ArsR family transcriptional regulator, arsenate/arsenite/antimonite-responsive transcriptional repressor